MTNLQFHERAILYAQRVTTGQIISCKQVKQACKRFLTDLRNTESRWFFVPDITNEVCRVAELMRHEKGQLQGQRFKLEDWQVFILCNIFGFIDELVSAKFPLSHAAISAAQLLDCEALLCSV